MGQLQESVFIRAPIDSVFPAITDPRRAPEWNPAVAGVENVAPGPPTVGSEWTQNTVVGGRTLQLTCRITRLESPTFGVLEITGDQQGKITTQCAEMDGGTQVTQTVDFVPPGGLFGQMAGSFITNALRREMIRTMDRQRTVIEAEYEEARRPQSL